MIKGWPSPDEVFHGINGIIEEDQGVWYSQFYDQLPEHVLIIGIVLDDDDGLGWFSVHTIQGVKSVPKNR